MSRILLLMTLALGPLASVAQLAGQAGGAGTLSGTVRTSEGAALGGAQIVVAGVGAGALSAADGRYQVTGIASGDRRVEVHLIGYRTAVATLSFGAAPAVIWDVTMVTEAVPLEPLEVTGARGATPALEGFYARRDRGAGHYYTRLQIERMNARDVTDVLRRVPGARVVPFPGPFGTTSVLQLGRSEGGTSGRPCPIFYYMNGVPFPVRADIGIDAYVRAQDVEAIEVYSGSSRLPPEFTSGGQGARCGVVAIWTKAGEGRTGPASRGG